MKTVAYIVVAVLVVLIVLAGLVWLAGFIHGYLDCTFGNASCE